jgi:hypothetical protein
MKTMYEVLDVTNDTHQMDLSDSQVRALAEALTAAGFGLVKEAQAGALREAADEMREERHSWCLDDAGRYWIKRTLDDLADRAASIEAP